MFILQSRHPSPAEHAKLFIKHVAGRFFFFLTGSASGLMTALEAGGAWLTEAKAGTGKALARPVNWIVCHHAASSRAACVGEGGVKCLRLRLVPRFVWGLVPSSTKGSIHRKGLSHLHKQRMWSIALIDVSINHRLSSSSICRS